MRDIDPVLVSAQLPRAHRIKAAEVEEAQRLAIYEVVRTVYFQPPGWQVPVGDVEGRVPEDIDPRPNPRREVDPALVDEAALVGIVETVVLESLRPPVEQGVSRLAVAEADEAQVCRCRQ